MARINFSKFKKAVNKVKTAAEKREETKLHVTRMAEMQRYVDMSPEKVQLLWDILHTKAEDCDKTILEKGAVVFVYYIEVLDMIKEVLENKGKQLLSNVYKYLMSSCQIRQILSVLLVQQVVRV